LPKPWVSIKNKELIHKKTKRKESFTSCHPLSGHTPQPEDKFNKSGEGSPENEKIWGKTGECPARKGILKGGENKRD